MAPTEPRPSIRWLLPLAADLVCVLALALGGMNSHEQGASGWVALAIAWPYALASGLAHAWLAALRRRTPRIWPEGAIILAATYSVGMLLRAASGRGLAPGFLVVAGAFLALTMLGWRGVVKLAVHLRDTRSPNSRREHGG